jgi:hypothetical protein
VSPEERLECWAELEEMVFWLRQCGWRVRKLTQVDEEGAPLQGVIRVERRGKSSHGEIL